MADDIVAAEQAPDEYAELRQHVADGVQLTDDEVDTIADVAVACLRDVLGFFGWSVAREDVFERRMSTYR